MGKDDTDSSPPAQDGRSDDRLTAAMRAVLAGDADALSQLVIADTGLADARGPHPIWGGEPKLLHVAAERDQPEIVRQLLDSGADVDGKGADYDNWSPLMLAAHGGRLGIHGRRESIVTLLLERGATVDVFAAALLNDLERLREELAHNPSTARQRGPADATALHFVRTPAAALLLLQAGADPDAECGWGTTPLERASFLSRAGRPVADCLIEAGARQHACALACLGGVRRLRALLDEKPEVLENRGKVGPSVVGTPLHGAAQHGHLDTARLLLDRGADINARADHGQTPLHLAINHLTLVQLLVEHGADAAAVDDDHGTAPIEWARFFLSNLEQGSTELPLVIDYLAGKT